MDTLRELPRSCASLARPPPWCSLCADAAVVRLRGAHRPRCWVAQIYYAIPIMALLMMKGGVDPPAEAGRAAGGARQQRRK